MNREQWISGRSYEKLPEPVKEWEFVALDVDKYLKQIIDDNVEIKIIDTNILDPAARRKLL